jgi:hypothetical protein
MTAFPYNRFNAITLMSIFGSVNVANGAGYKGKQF